MNKKLSKKQLLDHYVRQSKREFIKQNGWAAYLKAYEPEEYKARMNQIGLGV